MKEFMDGDFLLATKTARELFHEAAAGEPLFDYHCHLIPAEIAENRRFPNLADVWLGGDHYKWRALRADGAAENLITGSAEPYDKFLAWARAVPRLIGNPLYHWTHLELQRYFDIHEPLNGESARAIWDAANKKLANDPDLSVYGIFKKFKVFAVGTTDDPADSLEWHEKINAAQKQGGGCETRVMPSFRPDCALAIEKPDFAEYIAKLGKAAGKSISNLDDLLDALARRVTFFDTMGCRASDHGLEYMPFAADSAGGAVNHTLWRKEANETFTAALNGQPPDAQKAEAWKTFLLNFLAREYYERGWAMQIHLSVIRNNNTAAFKKLGPDTGFDAVNDPPLARKLGRFLDLLAVDGKLPKMILYSLNINDFYTLGTLMGCFQNDIHSARESLPGKMQLGSGWWYLDHIDGMETQMKILGNIGLLSRFVGMLTDSRSFLSYPRHEYFRRVLCNMLGNWAENGEIPRDMNLLGNMVKDISFRNAQNYFGGR